MNHLQNNYISILESLKEKIQRARIRAAVNVNVELLKLYWEIGNTILIEQEKGGWGAKIINNLAVDLKVEFPDFKGLSLRNLQYMRAFAEAYPSFSSIVPPAAAQSQSADIQNLTFVPPAVAQISWSHHRIILDRLKTPEERQFYIQNTAQNGWSKNILSLHIDSELHKRQGNAITNFESTLPAPMSDLARETLKNPYVFDFLTYSEELKERELAKALIQHLKKFMLELGKGFAYVGNQKNLVVEGDDFFLDMLFYNYHLHCFVVFELKVGDFKPEFAGKLNFYVNTVNEQLKGENDKPTIGVLLCKTPNETVVKYSLKGIDSPIGVADYELAKALPKQLTGEIPSIEELEAEIDKEYEELKSPSQKRFEKLKEKISELKSGEIKQTASTPVLFEIFEKSLLPLYKVMLKRLEDFNQFFHLVIYEWQGITGQIKEITELSKVWKTESFLKTSKDFYFSYRMEGMKNAGTEAFSIGFQLNYRIDTYWYGFTLVNSNNQYPFIKKLYHEQLTEQDIQTICDLTYNHIMDEIERNVNRIIEK